MRSLSCFLISLIIFLYWPQSTWAQFDKTFKTKFTTVYYLQNEDIDDFIWKLGGQKLELPDDFQLASNRIDRIIYRVQTILDMWPKNFSINIYLHRNALESNKVAYHDHKSKSIHISVDYASDGVVAHEIAHAVINQYFPTPPPRKMKEILSQYVDKHLWSDY